MAAESVASAALKHTCAATQHTATPTIVRCWPRITSDPAPSSALDSVHRWRRPRSRPPIRGEVRSESAPASGLAMTAASAPSAVTQPNIASLLAGSISSTWLGSSTWIGVKKAIHTPRLALKMSAIQPRRTGTAGSASAAGTPIPAVIGRL
jgi:hypothetical protein